MRSEGGLVELEEDIEVEDDEEHIVLEIQRSLLGCTSISFGPKSFDISQTTNGLSINTFQKLTGESI